MSRFDELRNERKQARAKGGSPSHRPGSVAPDLVQRVDQIAHNAMIACAYADVILGLHMIEAPSTVWQNPALICKIVDQHVQRLVSAPKGDNWDIMKTKEWAETELMDMITEAEES